MHPKTMKGGFDIETGLITPLGASRAGALERMFVLTGDSPGAMLPRASHSMTCYGASQAPGDARAKAHPHRVTKKSSLRTTRGPSYLEPPPPERGLITGWRLLS